MPHISVTIAQGKCKDKQALAQKIHDLVESEIHSDSGAVSVSIKEIPKAEWMEFIKTVPADEMVVRPQYEIK